MAITVGSIVEMLVAACPETLPIVAEHLSDYGDEVLLHLLMADVRRFAIEQFEEHHLDVLGRCLDVAAKGLTDGDEFVDNAVAVSFVEDTGWWTL